MENEELANVVSRKRLLSDAEKLKEQVASESDKIIKIKVAQDASNWEMRDKLNQTEIKYEKLRQNMVEVQMQYENMSSQYQKELQLRSETYNRYNSTRKICKILEESCGKLEETQNKCKNDTKKMYEAYQKAGEVVKNSKTKCNKLNDVVNNLKEKVKLSANQNTELSQSFEGHKKTYELLLNEMKEKVALSESRYKESMNMVNELNKNLDNISELLQKKERTVFELQTEINKMNQVHTAEIAQFKNIQMKLENELKDNVLANETLKNALVNQENFTRIKCDENNKLQDKISSLEEVILKQNATIVNLNTEVNEKKATMQNLKGEFQMLQNKKDEYTKHMNEKNQLLKMYENDITNSRKEITQMHELKQKLLEEIEKYKIEINEIRKMDEDHINTVNELQKDIYAKADTITKLMGDIKNGTDLQSRLETQIEKLKIELTENNKVLKESEKHYWENLESLVKEKEEAVKKLINTEKEMKAENTALNNDKISLKTEINTLKMHIDALLNGQEKVKQHIEYLTTQSQATAGKSKESKKIQAQEPTLLSSPDDVQYEDIAKIMEQLSCDQQMSPLLSSLPHKRSQQHHPVIAKNKEGTLAFQSLPKNKFFTSKRPRRADNVK